jgi:hypothetical protein
LRSPENTSATPVKPCAASKCGLRAVVRGHAAHVEGLLDVLGIAKQARQPAACCAV